MRTLPFLRLLSAGAAGLALALALPAPARAQGAALPGARSSPPASVTQTIGLTEVTVTYSRPGVKGRAIWGALVPYGEVWRAGADANTTIAFDRDVEVEGRPLAAGTYGLHTIPQPDAWTIVFSRNATSWGSYTYDESEDALRVTVTPRALPYHQERLLFAFEPLDDDVAELQLRWAELCVPVRLRVPLEDDMLANARDVWLRGTNNWNPAAFAAAARFCLSRERDLQLAERWAARAAELATTFTHLSLHADVLDALGRKAEAAPLRTRALEVATADELSGLGGQLVAAKRFADAVKLFKLAVAAEPGSWKAHEQLGEASVKAGDVDGARAAFRRALDLVADDGSRQRIEARLGELGS